MCAGQRRALPHVIVLLALSFPSTPVFAEEVLHCVDTENTGFRWGGGHASKTDFILSQFIVKIGPSEGTHRLVSENERLIAQVTGLEVQGWLDVYHCEKYDDKSVVCNTSSKTRPWFFGDNGHYVQAFLAGGPGFDPNISIAYGICTKP